ncbi:SDR family oxidoreductase [Pacificimonas flava]|uniref:FolM Alternative dihydrofolate reductase 1 n=1 Tax=Pacificimonas flava TaxID=1234595 RepID=M2T7X4_9SPHN|nr:SDR family oxidoreductase [Pacificimonas flava]EMD82629.1 FolM Alternative dihydrofolate reductase 1 [Pacificimonas flava]MBB5281454.1 NAD(P)-dependent dehydrogenase (short-subunit alcohol dehydrogenase family) [Pacificimonas flava]
MSLALVTGGTQRLGAVIAARLSAAGYDLALHYNASPDLDADLAAALHSRSVDHATFPADFAEPEASKALLAAVAEHFGRPPTLLVNSASRFGSDTSESAGADDLMGHFTINAAAPIMLSQAFKAALGEGEGCIVNILDQRLQQPHRDNFAYTISKFALAGATQTLARAWAPRIRVNAVAPGLTLPTDNYDPSRLNRVRAAMPLERLPSPQDVADAVAWLAGAKAVTGETVHVDGGARHRSFQGDFDRL